MTDKQEEDGQQERSPSYDSLFGGRDVDFNLKSSARSPSQSTPVNTTSPQEDEETRINSSEALPLWPGSDPTTSLSWVKHGLGVYPTWTISPRVESIVATLKLAMGSDQDYAVRFLHEGAVSKLYTVFIGSEAFVMRVCLPVHPGAKTETEVATLNWVLQHTPLPVPRIIAHDSSRDNPLGFEWVLMSKVEGRPLSESWWSTSLGSKERLVKQIAAFSAATFEQPLRGGIGGLYKKTADTDADHVVNEDERETLRHMLDLTRRIERLMPKFFPSPQPDANKEMEAIIVNVEKTSARTMLCHDSLSLDNIFVNNKGMFKGVIDWQCISCLPVHEACQFPAFLRQAYDRFVEPVVPSYIIDENGAPHTAYFRDYKQWEITRLRRLYVEEMMVHAPGFVDVWRDGKSANLRDYEAAVQNCDNEFTVETVEEWIEAMEHGRNPTQLPKRLHEFLAG
ncbi:hypothetical protein E0Z10_g6271 [Xylaria hypoxylon]|uniref:Aminoglycoside phosphotransferase domain-containing protein n=1 Tax=Xylaria hypoxylon TaxID=37992 RepID=A0A4Z0YTQ6_9PEZI|nr:hypothetical protein E0Z10_g6271 [Xylaria hypoxylon]